MKRVQDKKVERYECNETFAIHLSSRVRHKIKNRENYTRKCNPRSERKLQTDGSGLCNHEGRGVFHGLSQLHPVGGAATRNQILSLLPRSEIIRLKSVRNT